MLARSMSLVSVLVVLLVTAKGIALAQDSWNGGTGNWSNPGNWSAGLPGNNSDVVIDTTRDNVTLDTGATIKTLTLGDNDLLYHSSTLVGDGSAHTLAIAGPLTVNISGTLIFSNNKVVASSAIDLGFINLQNGSNITINGDTSQGIIPGLRTTLQAL